VSPQAKPCAKPGCGRLVPLGHRHCDEHAKAEHQRRARKRAAYGYDRQHWRQVRAQRLQLANHQCELQLAGCTVAATHVHLRPELRGAHDLATLDDTRACCASCSGAVDAPRSQTGGAGSP
jgi:5-methylcytosine-specific restriction protein A